MAAARWCLDARVRPAVADDDGRRGARRWCLDTRGRQRAAAQRAVRVGSAASPASHGRAGGHGRLRHRLLLAEPAAQLPVRQN